MTGMRFIGVERRAQQARAALNRLRWEADYAVENGRADDVASPELAECVGLLTNILDRLAQALPEQPANELEEVLGAARDRFVDRARYYTEYHRVPR